MKITDKVTPKNKSKKNADSEFLKSNQTRYSKGDFKQLLSQSSKGSTKKLMSKFK